MKETLQQMETPTENTTNQNRALWRQILMYTLIKHSLLWVWRTLWKRGLKDGKSQRIREFPMRLCLLVRTETTSTKSHYYDHWNVSWTRTTPMGMPKRTKGSSQGLNHLQRTRQVRKAGSGKVNGAPHGGAHQLVIQCQMVTPESTHTITLYWQNRLYLGLSRYTHIDVGTQ